MTETSLVLAYCLGVLVVLLAVAGALVFWGRWYLTYWLFLVRQWLNGHKFPGSKALPPSQDDFKYDAFVSYSHEDRNFVVRMVAMLERRPPHLNLCVFERDFHIGEIISDTVVESLESSRKTVLVLTDAFARSQWCLWEMQLAQHRRIFFRSLSRKEPDPLVIVKLGDIMEAHMTPTLRYLMRTRIYLEWSPDPKKQRAFWYKLRQALSPPNQRSQPVPV